MESAEDQPARHDGARSEGGLKKRLIEVTAELVREPRDVRLPTMREIATRAGVATGAAYRHFSAQHELELAVVAHLFGELETFLAHSTGREKDATGTIRAMAHAYVSWGIANPGGYQLLFETTDDDDLLAQKERPGLHLLEPLAVLLAHATQSHAPLIDEATLLWVSLHGMVSLRSHKTGMTWPASVEADVDKIVDLFLPAPRETAVVGSKAPS